MASQVTKSAAEKLREQLGNKITATYTKTLFSRLGVFLTALLLVQMVPISFTKEQQL